MARIAGVDLPQNKQVWIGLTYIHGFDDPAVIAGQGTIGLELLEQVPDVDAAFEELVSKGASPAMEPTTRPWGQRTAYVRDPDGHLVELAQDLGRR